MQILHNSSQHRKAIAIVQSYRGMKSFIFQTIEYQKKWTYKWTMALCLKDQTYCSGCLVKDEALSCSIQLSLLSHSQPKLRVGCG